MSRPLPGLDVPIIGPGGQVQQVWYEYFQDIMALQKSPITASLGADVALNNTGTFFDGPSIAQGSIGTWWVAGTVTLTDTAGSANFICELTDGTNLIATAKTTTAGGAGFFTILTLSGFKTSPAGNLRIRCKDQTSTSGKIIFNTTGDSKDSTISAHRIA